MIKTLAAKNISFSDSEFESLQMFDRENVLKIYLTSWDEREISLVFSNPIQFSYRLGDAISEFYEILESTPFLDEAISHYYAKIPSLHPFKLFQIWDINDFSIINVVAEAVIVNKGKNIVGFRSSE